MIARGGVVDGSRDLTTMATRVSFGAFLIALGWYQAHNRVRIADQTPWLALATGGCVIAAIGLAVWVLQQRRAVSQRLAALRTRIASIEDHCGAVEVIAQPVARKGARWFHRPGCVLVVGRRATAMSADRHRDAGRAPCEVCLDV